MLPFSPEKKATESFCGMTTFSFWFSGSIPSHVSA
jgi:hypothetical protein